jgi:dTMP kinase
VNGRFITVEGVEGAGKSTQLRVVQEYLGECGHDVLMTREPGGTPLAEKIRTLLLDPDNQGMDADAELLLVFAARAEHLHRRVRPALEAGRWVVSDRFTDATYAYQGGGRGLPVERIEALEHMVQGALRPDRVLVLDLPPEEGARRIRDRGVADRFEREALGFFVRVREAYLQRARQWPERYRVVDASHDVTTVSAAVREALADLTGNIPGDSR